MSGKFHLVTFGCQMNKNDSERVVGLLLGLGLKEACRPEDTDVLIINTCSVRQSAEDRVFGVIVNWQKLRVKRPDLIIGVTGCMPGRDKDGKLREKLPGVDLFFPMDELPQLPKQLRELNSELFSGDFENLKNYLSVAPQRTEKHRAFITIQTGCDNFCTYCVVPMSRGRTANRPVKEILDEVREAIKNGAKEIALLGQVVNKYLPIDAENFSKKNPFRAQDDFAALLWEINNIPGEFRINYTAPDPQYFCDSQIEALKLSKQVNYLHLPVQSGDNEILKKMNRKYTREYYLDLIKKIRQARPDIAIGTDIIVGFCGETEEQFNNTVDLFKQCDFDISYHAKYSQRSGTAAAKAFKDDVPKAEKKRRWFVLQDLMEEITERKNRRFNGQIISVLVDKWEDGVCSGNSNEMKLTQFLGPKELVGQIVPVEITRTDTWLLRGKLTYKAD